MNSRDKEAYLQEYEVLKKKGKPFFPYAVMKDSVMFLVTAILTASGAVVPGAVAIVVPIALGFAIQYGINPVLMGLFVINGATAGGFSPISVFGSIVNGVVENANLEENATLLFISSFIFNLLLSVVVFFIAGAAVLSFVNVKEGQEASKNLGLH